MSASKGGSVFCPRCDARLAAGAHGSLRCAEHGVFLPAIALRREIALPRHERRGESIRCPLCATRMREVRVPAPGAEPIHIDHCPACSGWWLDDGELERLRGAMIAAHEASAANYIMAGAIFGALGLPG